MPFCMTTRYPTDMELTILQDTKLMLTLETNLILWLGIQQSQDFLVESRAGVHRNESGSTGSANLRSFTGTSS